MKDAEMRLLQNDSEVQDDEETNIEQLQQLASKRRKLIDSAIQYKRNNKRTKWVQILQEWDDDHPCQ
jgi:CHASE3 domain sensor protein